MKPRKKYNSKAEVIQKQRIRHSFDQKVVKKFFSEYKKIITDLAKKLPVD